jgi:hypothetical protein
MCISKLTNVCFQPASICQMNLQNFEQNSVDKYSTFHALNLLTILVALDVKGLFGGSRSDGGGCDDFFWWDLAGPGGTYNLHTI